MADHIFMTGGTGMMGTNLVPRLLHAFPGSRVTLLMRGDSGEDIAPRRAEFAARCARWFGVNDAGERIRGVAGDVTREDLGLRPGELAEIARSATIIVHGAATIRFDLTLDAARTVNVEGTRRMLALAARAADSGALRRFVYIGTSSVSGRRTGRVYEHELYVGQQFFNTYEQSKCESEGLVWNHFDIVPCMVFRPSIVIGDSRDGRTTAFNVIYIPLRLFHRGLLHTLPARPGALLDLVPVDWVSDAMVHIITRPVTASGVYSLTAGPARAARLVDVVRLATAYFDAHDPREVKRTVEFVPPGDYPVSPSLQGRRLEAVRSQLDPLLPYLGIDRIFDSSRADHALKDSGLVFPRFETYAERIFDYCLRSRWGRLEC